MEFLVLAGILLALVFNFVNGMNDAANSIATIVATRVLSPIRAVAMAAFFNMIGPLVFTTAVAKTIGKGVVDPAFLTTAVIVIGLIVAILWVFLSSQLGIPISATHAIVGGLIGSAAAYAGFGVVILPPVSTVIELILYAAAGAGAGALFFLIIGMLAKEEAILSFTIQGALFGAVLVIPFVIMTGLLKVSGLFAILVFIVVSPLLGFITAYLISLLFIRHFRNSNPTTMNQLSKKLQIVSASFYSLGHGSNDAQNAMGIITALMIAGGVLSEFIVPVWVIVLSCAAIALGTLIGGWQVVRTMARRITNLRPYQGFCAETSGGVALSFVTSFGVPVSTTHAIAGAITGVGASRGSSAVQWGIVRQIVTAWILTIPITALTAFLFFFLYNAAGF
ncbi:MAG: Phosphate transporter family protein [Methanoregula sp. PtaU1.Bin051]|nr:MAG: Phosphate transporter family protein [Methanoregula sp. PtaU1.Bin051]